jgi:hypothetical protein
MVNFICSISSARWRASASAFCAFASATISASRCAMIIACAAAKSVGSESALDAMRRRNHKALRL